jgi:hypothetical protein
LDAYYDAYRHVELGLFSESVFLTLLEESALTTEQRCQLIHPASNFQRPDSGVNIKGDVHDRGRETLPADGNKKLDERVRLLERNVIMCVFNLRN